MTDDDFKELIAKVRAGTPGAMEDLAQLYEDRIRLVARQQLGPALRPYIDSVDLVQSAHRSVLIGLQRGKLELYSPEKLVGLAVLIVRRKVARHWRKMRRQQRLSSDGSPREENLPDVVSALTDPGGNPADVAARRDSLRRLYEQLDETQRRVVEMRFEGFSTAEIARQLGINGDSLRVQLSRLRARLKAIGLLDEWL
ncbi:MAG: sigma-70 family RNA polymerase sigma factor [Planctomycetales bacterium]|nr:sigma-70 family RNA polymerase sigma factor [Planctomycetales bacterium]